MRATMKKMPKTKAVEPGPDLERLRRRIDALDASLVDLLNDRTKIVLQIGELKRCSGGEVYVPAREKAVLERVRRLNQGPLPAASVQAVYREIMSAALALEHPLRVAYLGPEATFTHQAARRRFGSSVTYVPCETITDVFAAVQKQAADYGVVPVENSTDGAVTHTLDELSESPLRICAEVYLPIVQHLMSRRPLAKLRRVYSKPEVFGQCRRWLQAHLPGVDLLPASSTARAAELAAKEPGAGAIASALAAELHGLRIQADNIQDMVGNTTRFLVIGKSSGPRTGDDKTSIHFTIKDRVGTLHDALATLKRNRVNMSKIESRPSRAKAWEYVFFVDLDGHQDDPPLKRALAALGRLCTRLSVLGAYPRASGRDV
jgi:chorismate mutase / prephenate dehydratase